MPEANLDDAKPASRIRRHGLGTALTRVGEIPGYALWPGGGLCGTSVFYKTL